MSRRAGGASSRWWWERPRSSSPSPSRSASSRAAWSCWAACVVAGAAAWYGVLRRGIARVAGLAVAALALAGAVVAARRRRGRRSPICWSSPGSLVTLAAARADADGPRGPAGRRGAAAGRCCSSTRSSGGGKAERFALADEARARGIEPIELKPGEDLETLVRGAVERGADALAMAGGDGSQAIVAAVAAERGLPYACIPAGTRNHFALDLGVDRDDVVGALDAFVDGGERTVDLAEVNGRVFVNNVSLGALRRGGPAQRVPRREAAHAARHRARRAGPEAASELDLRWTGPGGQSTARVPRCWSPTTATGSAARSARARARGSTTACSASRSSARPRAAARAAGALQRPWREWSAPTFEVDSDRPVAAGIDGEALMLEPPLQFPHPARRAARARRAPAPGRLALGGGPRGHRGRACANWRASPSAATTHPRHHDKEARMDLMEITEKERLSREEAAARLHALADALARHNEVEFDRGGMRFKVHVPDEVELQARDRDRRRRARARDRAQVVTFVNAG